ncbi:hypothetical protein D5S17_19105 [Pseudonocardiaceae bacterium YIM PH 21723]|nr:hypothetical protein D5S17_19105 [Pseudonocardiaceae bacterium YIM PH 21723]
MIGVLVAVVVVLIIGIAVAAPSGPSSTGPSDFAADPTPTAEKAGSKAGQCIKGEIPEGGVGANDVTWVPCGPAADWKILATNEGVKPLDALDKCSDLNPGTEASYFSGRRDKYGLESGTLYCLAPNSHANQAELAKTGVGECLTKITFQRQERMDKAACASGQYKVASVSPGHSEIDKISARPCDNQPGVNSSLWVREKGGLAARFTALCLGPAQ